MQWETASKSDGKSNHRLDIAAMVEVKVEVQQKQEKAQEVIKGTQGKGPESEMTNFKEVEKGDEVKSQGNLGMKMFKSPR